MVAHYQGHAGIWNQDQVGPYNLNPMFTHHQGATGIYDPSLLASWNQDQMGVFNPNPMDTHHQSEIDSHQPSHVSPQNTNDADDLMTIFKSAKPIKTRVNQSPHGQQVHGKSYSVMPYRTALRIPNVQGNIPVLDTARVPRTKPSQNPLSRSKRQKE